MNLNPTDDRIKNTANSLFEPMLDELLQLSVWQHVMLDPEIVPARHVAAHDWVMVETPFAVNVVFYYNINSIKIISQSNIYM